MALLIKLIKKEDDDLVSAISIVDEPAILTNFMKFAKENKELEFAVELEKKQITGPVLIPNVKIFRSGKSLGLDEDAYVYFEEESVRAFAEDFIGNSRNNENTLNHREKTDKFAMIESWIIENKEKDKATALGFDLPVGTWMATYKVKDDELWEEVKSGNYNGFSVEINSTLVPVGQISLESEDERKVWSDELQPMVLNYLKGKGSTQEEMERWGFILVSEDDELTLEGKTIATSMAIEAEPNKPSMLDKGAYAIRYVYAGPRDGKNRHFCKKVLDMDQIYRWEDIDKMSLDNDNPEFGHYSIFQYKGSFNCRHRWVRQIYFAADWEEALANLESYVEWLGKAIATFGIILDGSDNPSYHVNWGLVAFENKKEEIEDQLKDFKKSAPFDKSNEVNPIDIPSGMVPADNAATKVNTKVGMSKEIKFETDIMAIKAIDELTEQMQMALDFLSKKVPDELLKSEPIFEEVYLEILKKGYDQLVDDVEETVRKYIS